jgi:hypothetical protein
LNEYLKKNQKKDGSFHSSWYINHGDVIQSTAYALNCLILFNRNNLAPVSEEIEKSIEYLLRKMITNKDKIFWKGGVMFSGGTVVRTSLFWKSDAYTTALILHAMSVYKNAILKSLN